ncbi:uncharacterized protein LOC120327784 [Styela clava]
MFSAAVVFLCVFGFTTVTSVEISLNVQIGGDSSSSRNNKEDLIAAIQSEDLRRQLTEKLEALLRDNPNADLTISTTLFRHNDVTHSTTATNIGTTTTNHKNLGATTPNVNPETDVTSSRVVDTATIHSLSTDEPADYSTSNFEATSRSTPTEDATVQSTDHPAEIPTTLSHFTDVSSAETNGISEHTITTDAPADESTSNSEATSISTPTEIDISTVQSTEDLGEKTITTPRFTDSSAGHNTKISEDKSLTTTSPRNDFTKTNIDSHNAKPSETTPASTHVSAVTDHAKHSTSSTQTIVSTFDEIDEKAITTTTNVDESSNGDSKDEGTRSSTTSDDESKNITSTPTMSDYIKSITSMATDMTDVLNSSSQVTESATKNVNGGSQTQTSHIEKCELRINDICYWTDVRIPIVGNTSSPIIDFKKALTICKSGNSSLAIIPNQAAYILITSYLRGKLPSRPVWEGLNFWTGIKFDPENKIVPSFVDWRTGPTASGAAAPSNQPPHQNDGWTRVYVHIPYDSEYKTWMANTNLSRKLFGFICSYRISDAESKDITSTTTMSESISDYSKPSTSMATDMTDVLNSSSPVTESATKDSQTQTIDIEKCELRINDTCYWTDINDEFLDVSHPITSHEAWAICESVNSSLTNIPNQASYEKITSYIRGKFPPNLGTSGGRSFWTGIKFDPAKGIIPSFVDWRTGPSASNQPPHPDYALTGVYVYIPYDLTGDAWMANTLPTSKLFGFICSYQI